MLQAGGLWVQDLMIEFFSILPAALATTPWGSLSL
jgi:hypothetical protein